MPENMPENNPDNAKPVSLRDTGSAHQQPAPQRSSPSPRLMIVVGFMAGAILMLACAMTTPLGEFALDSDNDEGGLSEAQVREIAAEVAGTQIAAQPVSGDGAVNPDAIQSMVDNAVSTEVAMLRPTTTPVPPTPTTIPVGVAEEDDAFRGPADAPVVIVEFSDFQCGYCGRWYDETLPKILEAYPDEVKFVYRDFPIFGEESVLAAMATECAEEQDQEAFWGMHNRLFERLTNQENTPLDEDSMVSFADDLGLDTDTFRECLTSQKYFEEVLADYRAAEGYGMRGTPGFVINGVVYPIGAQSFEVFSGLIEQELARLES